MSIKKVLREASKLATPSKQEQKKIELATSIVLQKLNFVLKRKRIKAKAICGGSFAKGTWLPSHTDIDCFIKFKYRTYKERSDELADILEPAIKQAFTHYVRLHGSRDYFQANYDDYVFEFVPVLNVKTPKKALNITDMSPLHIDWVKKHTKKTKIASHIRLAKLFFKATGVYGAESYIKGFSGHVVEILIIKYGSFLKLAKASQKWVPKVYIDPARHFIGKKNALLELNKSKLHSPLIVVDPTQRDRNAAAALDMEKYNVLLGKFKKFIASPHIDLFRSKVVTIKSLKKTKRKIIVLQASPEHDKHDVAGAKLLKQFEYLEKQLRMNDFKILDKGWQWRGEDALFWFYFDKELLSATKKRLGPPVGSSKVRIDGFLAKHGAKARRDAQQLYVVLRRKYRKPEALLKALIKEYDNIKIV